VQLPGLARVRHTPNTQPPNHPLHPNPTNLNATRKKQTKKHTNIFQNKYFKKQFFFFFFNWTLSPLPDALITVEISPIGSVGFFSYQRTHVFIAEAATLYI
jgi:hypothetical protein